MFNKRISIVLLVGVSAVMLWSLLAISNTFQTVYMVDGRTKLEITVVAERLDSGRKFGLRQIGTKNEFFVRGKLTSNVRSPLQVILMKDGKTEARTCPNSSNEPCFFTIRIDTGLQGQFQVAIDGAGPAIQRTAFFRPKTVLMSPFVDGILRG